MASTGSAPIERLSPALASPRLLEVSHVAHRLRASQEHVRRLIRGHELVAIRLGTRWRVDPRDLEAFLDAHRVPAVQLGANGRRR